MQRHALARARVLLFQFQVCSGISLRTMKALRFGGTVKVEEIPRPACGEEALVRVLLAGICNTDLEITRGYAGFRGTLGHEFVGIAEECDDASLVGKRVVGEINCGCGQCQRCQCSDARHCPGRTVLGIAGRDGAMAEWVRLPARNLLVVPGSIDNDQAVFTEPLAAACQILDQAGFSAEHRVLVLGDGKLGLLISQVLQGTGCALTVLGRHSKKLAILQRRGIATVVAESTGALDRFARSHAMEFDVVVEATGSSRGLEFATGLVRPRGTVVLKSTVRDLPRINTAAVVVNEITLVGSRCGRFAPALELLERHAVDVRSLIHSSFPLGDGAIAISQAAQPGALKVLLDPTV